MPQLAAFSGDRMCSTWRLLNFIKKWAQGPDSQLSSTTALSPFWKKRRTLQRPEQADAPQTQGDPWAHHTWNNMRHTHTFRLWKTWVVFNGDLLCFFQVLLSSQVVFCLVWVSGQSVSTASGVLNRKAPTARAAHLLLLPGLTLHLLPVPQLPDVLHLGLRDNIPPLEGKQAVSAFKTTVF